MKKIVLIFGGIAGLIEVAMMFITIPLYRHDTLSIENGLIIGYTTMVIAMSMIFFGVKSYRDNHQEGRITFGTAFKMGALIAGVAAALYVIGWEIDFRFFNPQFMQEYAHAYVKKAADAGATPEKIAALTEEMAHQATLYENVFIRMGYTLLEILPVGLVIALITAAFLRKKEVLPA